MPDQDPTLAALVDAENISHSQLGAVVRELAPHGNLALCRVYGDWTSPYMKGWRIAILESGGQPVQQFSNSVGKNSSDSALIIDAMDLLHQKLIDVFAIVSSDSDYTRLATRMREGGKTVIGIGRTQTPTAFIKACNRFVFIENLETDGQDAGAPAATTADEAPPEPQPLAAARAAIIRALSQMELSGGGVDLAALGSVVRRVDPAFDARTYGHKQFATLLEALDFDLERHENGRVELKVPRVDDAELKALVETVLRGMGIGEKSLNLAAVGNALREKEPNFDLLNAESKGLSAIVEAFGYVVVKEADGTVLVHPPSGP